MKQCIFCGEIFSKVSWLCPVCNNAPPIVNDFLAFSKELAEVNDGFDPASFTKLVELESRNFWFRSRNSIIIWCIHKYFKQAKTFLEIGCRTGFVLSGIEKAFPSMFLTGSEIYTTGLSFAAKRVRNAQLLQMDARNIPFCDEFDIIGAFDVLEHIEQDNLVLSQMHKAVRKQNGGIIITVPQHKFLWSQSDEAACHVRRYSSKELIQKVEGAGFTILKATSFVSLLFPLMVFSRLLTRGSKNRIDSELDLGSLTNSIFEKVLLFEHSCIKKGVSFPVGGSLLIVATANQD